MSIEQARLGAVGLGVGEEFEVPWRELEASVFEQGGDRDRNLPGILDLLKRKVQMQATAVARCATDVADYS